MRAPVSRSRPLFSPAVRPVGCDHPLLRHFGLHGQCTLGAKDRPVDAPDPSSHIGAARWRKLHRLTAVMWLAGLVHALGEGTDAGQIWFLAMIALVAVPALALLATRWLGGKGQPSVPPARRGEGLDVRGVRTGAVPTAGVPVRPVGGDWGPGSGPHRARWPSPRRPCGQNARPRLAPGSLGEPGAFPDGRHRLSRRRERLAQATSPREPLAQATNPREAVAQATSPREPLAQARWRI
jgi:hypothetical protein